MEENNAKNGKNNTKSEEENIELHNQDYNSTPIILFKW